MKIKVLVSCASIVAVAVVGGLIHSSPAQADATGMTAVSALDLKADRAGSAFLSERSDLLSTLPTARPFGADTPLQSELKAASDGRVLLGRGEQRISAIPTTAGSVCFIASTSGRADQAGCFAAFPSSGVMYVDSRAGDAPEQVVGIVADDVTAVEIETLDGKSHQVAVNNGAFWWSADKPGVTVASATSVRGGVSITESKLFARPAPTGGR